MKITISLLTFLLMMTGCSLIKDDGLPLSLELSSNSTTYTVGESVTVTASIRGGSGDQQIFWQVDSKEYVSGGATTSFTTTSSSHSVQCSVTVGSKNIVKSIVLKSSGYSSLTPVQRYGKLQVKGTNLCDENGSPIQLRGVSTHGIQYYDEFYNENVIQSLAVDWKADIIRVSCYVNEGWPTTYLDNPQQWRTYVDQMVDWAEKYGIYVLIDWHMLSPGDPNYYLTEAKEFWEYMVTKHGNKQHVLFDICNEPNNDGLTTWKRDPQTGEYVEDKVLVEGKNVTWPIIKTYADTIMGIIRAKSENVAIIGTPEWASNPEAVIGNELNFKNIMYTMHFYATEHGDSYRTGVEKAIQNGIPVFVTEFGTQEASGDGVNDFVSSQLWLDLLDKHKISWVNWNISNDERTGAIYLESFNGGTTASYSDTTKMKDAGKWIFNKIRNR